MRNQIYVTLLIICVSLSQGSGTFSAENIKKSSDLHIRKKRLIDKTPYANSAVRIQDIPYIVNVHKNGTPECGGSILSPQIILSAAHCFQSLAEYSIRSGSSYADRGIVHNIIRQIPHPHYHPRLWSYDLILLIIDPPIDFEHSPNRPITLYNGHIPPNTVGIVSGWGCTKITRSNRQEFPKQLRSISLPIMSQESCENYYVSIGLEITNKNICTLDESGLKYCGAGDSGDPLVVEGELAGIFTVSLYNGGPDIPDVYMNLSHPEYRNWILANMQNIARNANHSVYRHPFFHSYNSHIRI